MDKEPSLADIWTWSAAFIGAAALLARWKPWLPIVVWPISTFFGVGLVLELTHPHVGPDILQEAGWTYVAQAYASVALCTIGPVAALAWGLRRHRKQ